jgi:hypothetical protein
MKQFKSTTQFDSLPVPQNGLYEPAKAKRIFQPIHYRRWLALVWRAFTLVAPAFVRTDLLAAALRSAAAA